LRDHDHLNDTTNTMDVTSSALVLILITLVAGTVNGALGYGFSSITFRRVCMSFDTWVVGFGISTLLRQLHVIETQAAFFVLAAVGLLDTWLLYRFFHAKTPEAAPHARRSSAIPMRLSPADAEPSAGNGRLAAAASSSSPIPPSSPPVLDDVSARIT